MFTVVFSFSGRPIFGAGAARRTGDRERIPLFGDGRRSPRRSLSSRILEDFFGVGEREVDDEPDDGPDHEPEPSVERQERHHEDAHRHAKGRHDPHGGRLERTVIIRSRDA